MHDYNYAMKRVKQFDNQVKCKNSTNDMQNTKQITIKCEA